MISIIFVLTVISILLPIDNIRLYRAISEIGKNLHEAKDILNGLQKEHDKSIDLATKLGYERSTKDLVERMSYARSWEEEFKNAS